MAPELGLMTPLSEDVSSLPSGARKAFASASEANVAAPKPAHYQHVVDIDWIV